MVSLLRQEQKCESGKMKNLLITEYHPFNMKDNTKLASFWALIEQTRKGTCGRPYWEFQKLHKNSSVW